MGADKALLEFCGRPLVQIAVEKLREFCSDVSIVGDREDLKAFAPVERGERADAGPGAGIEAALGAVSRDWAMFLPVDVPLVPIALLKEWVNGELTADSKDSGLLRGCGARLPWASYLVMGDRVQPAVALLHRDCRGVVSDALDAGERRLVGLFEAIQANGGVVRVHDAARFAPGATRLDLEVWFSNVNTRLDFEDAERWARTASDRGAGS